MRNYPLIILQEQDGELCKNRHKTRPSHELEGGFCIIF
jgi:hypothetical protein